MNIEVLKKYAKLLVCKGANLQEGQMLIITSSINDADLARLVADEGYANGASEVVILWDDEYIKQQYYLKGSSFIFDETPEWMQARYDYYFGRNACYIHIKSDDPELLTNVLPDRIARNKKATGTAVKRHMERTMGGEARWTVGAAASPKWAVKVFPNIPVDQAVEKLWAAIVKCSRLDSEDPLKAWEEHNKAFAKRLKFLNGLEIKSLHFKNSLGTDLTVELPQGAIWGGAGEFARDGIYYFPNIPTEEIFTAPKKTGINGRIVSSMPLCYSGKEIEGIELELKDGRIISSKASKNSEVLQQLIETDEGAHYLGEVALVPNKSPISDLNMLFYNTLFDENASCHFAIGKAYPNCLAGFETMSKEEMLSAGLNDSLTHVDFMIGTPDLSISAIDKNGNTLEIFKNGNYAEGI